MPSFESERRPFVRLNTEVPVRYRFLSKTVAMEKEEVHTGSTTNLGTGGMLLVCKIPKPEWYADLLSEQIVIGIVLDLLSEAEPIKALCRVSWVEAVEHAPGRVGLGLVFKEIPKEGKDAIQRFIIKSQLK